MKRYSHQQIEALLDKFMDGQTTVEEEALLADYFRSGDVPAEWEDYRDMFDYFDRGMKGDLVSEQAPHLSLNRQMGRQWWGIAAAAVITAAIVGTTVLHQPTQSTITDSPPYIAETVDSVATPPVVETEPLQLASASPARQAAPARNARSSRSTRRLKARNDSLARENERLQRELDDLKRRAFIIDMEAMGYKAIQDEDGNIVFIDLNQEIENELNNQPSTNIPAL